MIVVWATCWLHASSGAQLLATGLQAHRLQPTSTLTLLLAAPSNPAGQMPPKPGGGRSWSGGPNGLATQVRGPCSWRVHLAFGSQACDRSLQRFNTSRVHPSYPFPHDPILHLESCCAPHAFIYASLRSRLSTCCSQLKHSPRRGAPVLRGPPGFRAPTGWLRWATHSTPSTHSTAPFQALTGWLL